MGCNAQEATLSIAGECQKRSECQEGSEGKQCVCMVSTEVISAGAGMIGNDVGRGASL
jgi:hypothetical protein